MKINWSNYTQPSSTGVPPIKHHSPVKLIAIPIIFVVLVIVFISSFYTVKQNQYAYITRFAQMVDLKTSPGPYFKIPFVDNVTYIPSHQMLYDIPPSDVITSDKQTLVVDNFTVWRITDPQLFMRTIANTSEMENRISASVYSAVKNLLGSLTREQIINEDTHSVDKIGEQVTQEVNKTMSGYGVQITSVEIKRMDLPDSNADAVYTRMISERSQMADAFIADGNLQAQKIRNETDKQVSILMATAKADAEKIEGEAESEYMKILSEAYSTPEREEFYKFVRGLDALKVSMNSNNKRTLILDDSSYIVQLLLGKT